jgi:hypothetical protein
MSTPSVMAHDDEQPIYQGQPLEYWLEAIRNRDRENLMLAFDAIRTMGEKASKAVPELTRMVSAPFHPIEIGKDSDYAVAMKLFDIAIRSEAIDTLAGMGESASSATLPVVLWALTVRVIPARIQAKDEHALFVELVALDVEYRMAVLNTIRDFGPSAIPIMLKLLKSDDAEKRKLAVVILGVDLLPIVTELLHSTDCYDEQLGVTILGDMVPLVPKAYLTQLKQMIVCQAN